MHLATPRQKLFKLLLFSLGWTLALWGSEATAGALRAFEVKPGSELRVWITQEVGGVVQPPSIGQPPSVSPLSGTIAADVSGSFWTLTNIDMVAEDLTVSFLYPMTDISFVNGDDLVGFAMASILNLEEPACVVCTDFAVDFEYTFGIRPPATQPVVDPLELIFGLDLTITGSVLTLSGTASDGFIAFFENASVPPGPLPLWIELDMVWVEVPVEPTELFEIQPGSEIRIYETAVVGGEAQEPDPGQAPSATSVLSGVVDADRDVDFWSFTLVDLEAADTSITLNEITVDVTDITVDMPFAGVPDSDGVPQTVSQLNGLETASLLSIAEVACAGCTDFASRFGFTIGVLSPFEIALIEPLDLDVTMDASGTSLSGTFADGAVLNLGGEVGIWIEGDFNMVPAPEPSYALLAGSALVGLGLLARRRRAGLASAVMR